MNRIKISIVAGIVLGVLFIGGVALAEYNTEKEINDNTSPVFLNGEFNASPERFRRLLNEFMLTVDGGNNYQMGEYSDGEFIEIGTSTIEVRLTEMSGTLDSITIVWEAENRLDEYYASSMVSYVINTCENIDWGEAVYMDLQRFDGDATYKLSYLNYDLYHVETFDYFCVWKS